MQLSKVTEVEGLMDQTGIFTHSALGYHYIIMLIMVYY